MIKSPYIPNNIVVHIGEASNSGKNITIPFIEYIKNVSSGELYPNWPEEALRANILAIISFTLNRVYNEWYRSQGFDFDITSSTKQDQSYVEDRQFFERTSLIVDEIFNNYIIRNSQVQPLFATYCDGRNTTCNGLSQWGTVELANKGLSYLDILKKYYGNDISIVNSEVSSNISSYPGFIIKLGDAGNFVKEIKINLNRIGKNYPAIPVILNSNSFFDLELENAIKKFQEVFNLKITGVIDKITWYKIKYLYNAVKNISNIYSEGISIEEVTLNYPNTLKKGDTGKYILELNYLLSVIAYFDNDISFLKLSGDRFDINTENTVKSFQKKYNLDVTGVVTSNDWKVIREVYESIIKVVPKEYMIYVNEFYPGRVLSRGMSGDDIVNLQRFLYLICEKDHSIPGVVVNGNFDSLTEKSVKVLQRKFNLESNGYVGAATWYNIVELSKK